MPTYEYLCGDCNHQFEEFQSITAEPLDTCPKCNGSVKRLISSGNGLIFKGSGFYITDYKKSNKKSNGASDSNSKSDVKAEKKENTPSGTCTDSK